MLWTFDHSLELPVTTANLSRDSLRFHTQSHPYRKKGTKFISSQKCEDNFNKLKELLTTAPILKVVDPDQDFIVCLDARKEVLGGVLTQEGHVICYESQKIKEHE
jgi:hypothetical protein